MSEETKTEEVQEEVVPKAGDNGKLCAFLAYWLLGIIWYFADENMKKNNFVKFHVKQSLILMLVSIIGSVVLGMIPFIGWLILPFFSLATLILWIVGLINAINGSEKELPIIGSFANQLFKF